MEPTTTWGRERRGDMARSSYHHGDLRAALVQAGLAAVAEHGIAALSIADAARRAGVSPAAPYRHFPSRQSLLVAVAVEAATELRAELRAALADPAAPDAPDVAAGTEALAAAAAVYVRFLARRRVGLDLVFAPELAGAAEPELSAAGRDILDLLLPAALAVTRDAAAALDLLEQHIAVAHGYGALYLSGFLQRRLPDIEAHAQKAAATARTLAAAAAAVSATQGDAAPGS